MCVVGGTKSDATRSAVRRATWQLHVCSTRLRKVISVMLFGMLISSPSLAADCRDYKVTILGGRICLKSEEVCAPSANFYLSEGIALLFSSVHVYGVRETHQIEQSHDVLKNAVEADPRAKKIVAHAYMTRATMLLRVSSTPDIEQQNLKDARHLIHRAEAVLPGSEKDWVRDPRNSPLNLQFSGESLNPFDRSGC